MIICSNCKTSLEDGLNFCTFCGHQIKRKEKIKKPKREILKNTKSMIPILSGIGLIIILYSLFSLLEVSIEKVSSEAMITVGYSVSGISLVLGLLVISRSGPNALFGITLLLLSEGTTYISSFFYDAVFRTQFSRYLLLGIALLIATFGTFSSRKLEESSFQMIHRVIASYVGWITILYLGGTDYISTFWFTVSIIYLIMILHGSGVLYPSLPILGSSIIIETLVLMDTEVINTSDLFWIAMLHVILLPVMLYFMSNSTLKIEGIENKSVQKILSIYFLPLFPIFIAMSRGAIQAPFSHLLVAIFAIAWILYLTSEGTNQDMREGKALYNRIAVYALLIVLTVYSLFNTATNVLIMEIGIILVLIKLRKGIPALDQKISRLGVLIPVIITTKLIYLDQRLSVGITALHFILVVGITYFTNIRENDILEENEISLILIGYSINTAYLFLLKATPIFYLYLYLVSILGILIYLWISRKYDFYLPLAIMFSSVFLASYTFNQEIGFLVFQTGLIGAIVIFIIGLVMIKKKLKHMQISWVIMSVPLIFGTDYINSHWNINLFALLLVGFGIVSAFKSVVNRNDDMFHLIFLFTALWIRLVTYGEFALLFGYSVWTIATFGLYVAATSIILIVYFRKYNKSWIYTTLSFALLLVFRLLIVEYSGLFNDDSIIKLTLYISQFAVLLLLIITYLDLDRISTMEINTKLMIVSIVSIFNFILISGLSNTIIDALGISFTIILLMIGNKINRETELTFVEISLFIVAIFSNLIGFGVKSRFTLDFLFTGLYFLFIYSNVVLSATKQFKEDRFELYNELVYVFVSILLMIFAGLGTLELIDAIIIFQILSIIAFIKRRGSFNKNLTILLSNIYLILNTIWLSSLFALDSFIFGIYSTESIVNIVRLVINTFGLVLFFFSYLHIRSELVPRKAKNFMPDTDFQTVGIAVNIILLYVITALQLIHTQILSSQFVNLSSIIMMPILLIMILIYQRIRTNGVFGDAVLIASFFLLIETSLLQFFNSPISNLIFAITAIGVSGISLKSNEKKLIRISLAISAVSVFKFLLDLIFLSSTLEKSISGIFVGLQILWYAAFYVQFTDILEINLPKEEEITEETN